MPQVLPFRSESPSSSASASSSLSEPVVVRVARKILLLTCPADDEYLIGLEKSVDLRHAMERAATSMEPESPARVQIEFASLTQLLEQVEKAATELRRAVAAVCVREELVRQDLLRQLAQQQRRRH